jgi:hypothetical protein
MPISMTREALAVQGRVDGVHGELHLEGAGDGALGVVGVGDRGAEQGEDRVAEELVDRAAVAVDHLGHRAEVDVEDRHDLLRAEALAQRREAAQVGQQDGDLAALAAELQRLGRGEQGVDHVVGDVAAEHAADEGVAGLDLVDLDGQLLLDLAGVLEGGLVEHRQLVAVGAELAVGLDERAGERDERGELVGAAQQVGEGAGVVQQRGPAVVVFVGHGGRVARRVLHGGDGDGCGESPSRRALSRGQGSAHGVANGGPRRREATCNRQPATRSLRADACRDGNLPAPQWSHSVVS